MVQHYTQENTQKHLVGWNGQMLVCSCKHFEFWGIICRHILSVFLHQDVFTIPSSYFPLRWHSKIESDQDIVDLVDETTGESYEQQDTNLAQTVHCPPKSKTKGRPKSKRAKRGKEMNMKQVRSCRFCKQQGHMSGKGER
ncbi:protein FAR1-RELATED SEQUENCE 1-like [Daucus carota subsp. sativus]|uniref:protein FAR1-RELATED SEQUENCE 1-like n=1 Tax=Daucus carota subsp. sativus TaxID=79200 RepID=UPI003083BF40